MYLNINFTPIIEVTFKFRQAVPSVRIVFFDFEVIVLASIIVLFKFKLNQENE
jgi:hypothetical protein